MSTAGSSAPIAGQCDSAFETVREVFEENFRSRGEVGAAVCVYKEGRKVVDLWGGYLDRTETGPWAEDTLVCMFSTGKAMPALCVHMLVDRGQIDLAEPVVRYWPAFGQAGKEAITVKQLLGGLAALPYADLAPVGAMTDWDVMVDALERQAPEWPPGTRGAYHSNTWGYLIGELLHKVDGRDFATFFRQEVTDPLGVEYTFKLTDADLPRVSDVIGNPDSATLNAMADLTTNIGRAWRPKPDVPDFFNSPEFRSNVMPSGNGHSNARSAARIFAVLAEGGELDGVRLLSREQVELIREPQWDERCGLTERHYKYGLGFFLNKPPTLPMGRNLRNFGHPGAGGAIGIADPESRMSFSYCPNFMCGGEGMDARGEELIRAALG